jgi:beta-barrel assembly-enhancing protease
MKDFTAMLEEIKHSGEDNVAITVYRAGRVSGTVVRPDRVCDYGTLVVNSGELNAFADGRTIYVTSAMMRFLSNDELRVVIAHEFAHNAMGHIKAKKKNSIFGAVLGALGDVFMASQGINTGGYYTSQGAKAGATVFSQDFEREADYVGLYALTLADLPLDPAPMFWRHMAQAEPKSIGFASTHPTTAERFVRMEQAITEIREKTASHQALLPSKKGAPESGAEEPKLAVANPLPQRITTPVSASNPLAQMINTDARAPTADSPLPAVSGYSAMADTLPDYVARPDEAPSPTQREPRIS